MPAKFDFHIHTRYSDGTTDHATMIEAAVARGLEAIAFTDHGPELSVGTKFKKLPQMLRDMEIAKEDADITVLAGIEANVVDDQGNIDLEDGFLKKLDIVAVGIHDLGTENLIEMPQNYLLRATGAIKRRGVDVFCHPFYFDRDLTLDLSPEDVKEFVRLAAERGIAMEVNGKYKAPSDEFLALCLREGVKLSMGTDAHRPHEVGRIDWVLSVLKRVGARRQDLILDSFLR